MLKILETVLRICVMYAVSVFLMRIAGKKEVSQLEINDLVTVFMVSEIACNPITDPEVPVVSSIIYSAAVIALGMLFSYLGIKIPLFKHLIMGKPDYLIVDGVLDQGAFHKSKVSLSELVSAMRQKGISAVDEIGYAVQEPDGTISIIERQGDNKKSVGLQHMLISDGELNKTEMDTFGYSERAVENILKKQGISDLKAVFYLGVDDGGNVFLVKNKEESRE